MIAPDFDVAIAGGGFAGSSLAGVLARGGLRVIVIEREQQFRDRIRGEFTWPWGVAEIDRLGLRPVFEAAGALPMLRMDEYLDGSLSRTIDVIPRAGLTYQHAPVQDALLAWAETQGATLLRPARVSIFSGGEPPRITITHGGTHSTISAKLIIAASGRDSAARIWTGGDSCSDDEHHRFGGISIEGARFPSGSLLLGQHPPEQALLFDLGQGMARLYLRTFTDELAAHAIAHSFEALLDYVQAWFPSEILSGARPVGPLGFFPNSNTWGSTLTGRGAVLLGDVAGSADPSGGHGTSLVFRDVRVLSELLLQQADWSAARDSYARERARLFRSHPRARDRWYGEVAAGRGPEGERRRARQAMARELDPTLGGFGAIEFMGPDGLTPDDAHRASYFGEHISLEDRPARS